MADDQVIGVLEFRFDEEDGVVVVPFGGDEGIASTGRCHPTHGSCLFWLVCRDWEENPNGRRTGLGRKSFSLSLVSK